MKFRVSSRLEYALRPPVVLFINLRASISPPQRILRESLRITPEIGSELIVTALEKNRFDRLRVADAQKLTLDYEAEVETNCEFLDTENLRKVSPAQLNPAHLPYLFPSRYCQSDRLGRFAWQRFGRISAVYDQVLEITNWIHENIEYLPGTTTSATSAYDTVTDCAGVCRDFAHLGIALCRAMTIPARYFTGYAYRLDPPDFHACFEAFIGGRWILFDPTRLASPNGLVRIGYGRDATDVSVCTAFGIARSSAQQVACEVLESHFQPVSEDQLKTQSVSLDTVQA